MKIVTEHVFPPIPFRRFDWAAMTDNYEPGAPSGEGPTEAAAIADLLDNHCKVRGADVATNGECMLCNAVTGERCRLEKQYA